MVNSRRLVSTLPKPKAGNQRLFFFIIFIFFWTLFDGTISFLTPRLITAIQGNEAKMGLILATSSVWGAIFDFLIARNRRRLSYRRLLFYLLAICAGYPLLLHYATKTWLMLIAMAVWGLYSDIFRFSIFNFISHETPKEKFAFSFGLIDIFKTGGYLLAPLIIGIVLTTSNSRPLIYLGWFFLGIALIALLLLTKKRPGDPRTTSSETHQPITLRIELALWRKIGRNLLPVLMLTFFLNIWDAFFWTLGPLLSHSPTQASFFVTAYMLPALFVTGYIRPLTHRWGKKRTAIGALLAGSATLSLIFICPQNGLEIGLVFLTSCLISVAWPATNGAYADYIKETASVEKEIAGLQDFFANSGYILGPILAGWLGQRWGELPAFSILGGIGLVTALTLITVTPRKIRVRLSS